MARGLTASPNRRRPAQIADGQPTENPQTASPIRHKDYRHGWLIPIESRPRDWYVPATEYPECGYGWHWFGHSAIYMAWAEPNMKLILKTFWISTLMHTYILDVNLCDTILTVKSRLQAQEGIPVDHQLLEFPGALNLNLPRERRTLLDFNIPKESTLTLSVAGQIYVKTPTGKTLTLDKVYGFVSEPGKIVFSQKLVFSLF